MDKRMLPTGESTNLNRIKNFGANNLFILKRNEITDPIVCLKMCAVMVSRSIVITRNTCMQQPLAYIFQTLNMKYSHILRSVMTTHSTPLKTSLEFKIHNRDQETQTKPETIGIESCEQHIKRLEKFRSQKGYRFYLYVTVEITLLAPVSCCHIPFLTRNHVLTYAHPYHNLSEFQHFQRTLIRRINKNLDGSGTFIPVMMLRKPACAFKGTHEPLLDDK
ncbi:Hypothetical predicted protein, partial [Paramuricea clavata]